MALKDLPREELLYPGTGACAGCAGSLALRTVLKALGERTILVIPASCTASIEGHYPTTPFRVPVLTIAFAAAGAAASGLSAAMKRLGQEETNVVVWAGDGGTYDIGLQALSGAVERGTNFIYICYNNEIYSNTGVQRSGATPFGAWSTTTWTGKTEQRKDMPGIMRAHDVAYMATASASYVEDLFRKLQHASSLKGPKYIEIHTPCSPGWRFPMDKTVEVGRLAVETGAWALYEYENGRFTFNGRSKRILERKVEPKPLEEYLQLQGRFKHLFKPSRDEARLERIKEQLELDWDKFRKQVECAS